MLCRPKTPPQAEKEKQLTFQAQLRQQARNLLEDNAADDAATQDELARLEKEAGQHLAAEAQELEER